MSTVLFMPTRKFGPVSIDGINHLEFTPGKDENGRPFVFEIPEHQARIWQDDYKWGEIVSKQEVLMHTDGSPINQSGTQQPPAPPEPEILQAPQISIAANQQPLPTAAPNPATVPPPTEPGKPKGKAK